MNFLSYSVKLIEYRFYAESVCCNPCVGSLRRIDIFFPVINLCGSTHIYSKGYYIVTSFITKMREQSISTKSNTIGRIFIPININIFVQTNCTKQAFFLVLDNCLYYNFYLYHKQCKFLLFFHECM